jgi:2-dehydropantoate 2-reductase
VIVGAGAIGATIGGRLADAGHPVALVARGEHAHALQVDGLRLALPDRELRLRLPTSTLDDLALAAGDVLIVAVKSQHSESVMAQLAAIPVDGSSAGETLPIVSAQNGISNEDCALRFFAAVHGMCVNLPATHLEPGRVDANGAPESGVLQVGRYPFGADDTSSALVAALAGSGFGSAVREDVMAWKRAKLVRNLANALEVLCAGSTDRDGLRAVRQAARAEALAGFAAAGWSCTDDEEWDSFLADRARAVTIGDRPRQGGSTWQSIERGQGSVETDFLNGEIVRLGRLYGIATPVNTAIQTAMRRIDPESGRPSPLEPSALIAH